MTQEQLDTFKTNARTLYNRGLISQRMCVTMLGQTLPKHRFTTWFFLKVTQLTAYIVKETKDETA